MHLVPTDVFPPEIGIPGSCERDEKRERETDERAILLVPTTRLARVLLPLEVEHDATVRAGVDVDLGDRRFRTRDRDGSVHAFHLSCLLSLFAFVRSSSAVQQRNLPFRRCRFPSVETIPKTFPRSDLDPEGTHVAFHTTRTNPRTKVLHRYADHHDQRQNDAGGGIVLPRETTKDPWSRTKKRQTDPALIRSRSPSLPSSPSPYQRT